MLKIILLFCFTYIIKSYADDAPFTISEEVYKDKKGNLYSHDKKSNLSAMFLQRYKQKAFTTLIKENAIMRFSIFDYHGILIITIYDNKDKYNLSLLYNDGFLQKKRIVEINSQAKILKHRLPLISKTLTNKKFGKKLLSLSKFERNMYTEIGSTSVNTLEYYQDKKQKCIDMNFKKVLSGKEKDFEKGIYKETQEIVLLLNSILDILNMKKYSIKIRGNLKWQP